MLPSQTWPPWILIKTLPHSGQPLGQRMQYLKFHLGVECSEPDLTPDWDIPIGGISLSAVSNREAVR